MGLYYRYRPMSELSIKELMYDEMFFASAEESNDPYEGKIFFKFGKFQEKWRRLLELAWKDIDLEDKDKYIEVFSKYLTNKSPLTFDEIQTLDFKEIKEFETGEVSLINAYLYMIPSLKKCMEIYKPDRRYFVSFSKVCDNYLMWSHYANKHNGYCLIFRSIDNGIYQSPKNNRNNIRRYTSKAFAQTMSHDISEKFEVLDVLYNDKDADIDAFLCFPKCVNGHKFENEGERIELCEKPFLEKHSCWSYEKESRLLLSTPFAWLFGENIEYTKNERLFHYDPSQLVGIILGYRMSKKDRDRIREIICEKLEKRYKTDSEKEVRRFFDFVIFDAELSQRKRIVEVVPNEIYTCTGILTPKDESFENQYEEWKQGYCIERQGVSSSKVKIE